MIDVDDERAILELTARYGYLIDTRGLEELGSLFAEDAVWDGSALGHGRHEGHEAVAAFFSRRRPGRTPPRRTAHQATGHVLEATGDGEVRGVAYFCGHSVYPDRGVLVDTGYYHDVYSRAHDGWRIRERVLRPIVSYWIPAEAIEDGS